MIIRDPYFAAFLIENGFLHQVTEGKLRFDLSKKEFSQQRKSYENSALKRHCDIAKSLIASLAAG